MSGSGVMFVKRRVNGDEESLTELMNEVRPAWGKTGITIKRFTEGLTNQLHGCFEKTDVDRTNGVMVRIYGGGVTNYIQDRNKEVMAIQLVARAGIAQPLVAIFENGIVYGFAPGSTLDTYDFHSNESVRRSIAKGLAKLHSIDITEVEVMDINGKMRKFPAQDTYYPALKKYVEAIPKQLADPERDARFQAAFTRQWLNNEMDFLVTSMRTLGVPQTLSHNDVHMKNIIYDHKTGTVNFVDWENCTVNFQLYDIGAIRDDRTIMQYAQFIDPSTPRVDEGIKQKWAEEYHAACRELRGEPAREMTETERKKLVLGMCLGNMYFWLMSMIWVLGSVEDEEAQVLDPIGGVEYLIASYKERKSKAEKLTKELYPDTG